MSATSQPNPDHREQVTFHVTGKRLGDHLGAVETSSMRPALLSVYRDLSKLRYDFPMVLVDGVADADGYARSLTDVVNGILRELAPKGITGERLRKHAFRLEAEIRKMVADGAKGSLSEIWRQAAKQVLTQGGGSDGGTLSDSLDSLRGALALDGRLLDAHGGTAREVVVHAWRSVHLGQSTRVLAEIDDLCGRLASILRLDDQAKDKAQTADELMRVVGRRHEALFDFQALAKMVGTRQASAEKLSDARRKRIEETLAALEGQRFFARPKQDGSQAEGDGPHSFVFADCASALQAFQERLPEIAALVKAIAIAKLEAVAGYDEAKHDALFAQFDETCLLPEDYAMFPSYVVRLCDGEIDEAEQARLIEIISSDLPFKVLMQTDDILARSPVGNGYHPGGLSGLQIASMALGLGSTYVMQASASHLCQVADRVYRGIAFDGPALICVYSGAHDHSPQLPVYLRAAAAMQSRIFPSFSYDPSSGPNWLTRFALHDNPQVQSEWPTGTFSYEDEELQRHEEEMEFSVIDFIATDDRYADHFAVVSHADWHDDMAPAARCLEPANGEDEHKVPYILMVDSADVLHRVIVDDSLLRSARRFLQKWQSFQELDGIRNSHAEMQLSAARKEWEMEKYLEIKELKASGALAAGPPSEAEAAQAKAAQAKAAAAKGEPIKEAFIDTMRCSTCNECTNKNPRMFKYNENKQAYIADKKAGTYRELVEAAEKCQVAIIHPGEPWNPDEPDLEDLKKRAAPFNQA